MLREPRNTVKSVHQVKKRNLVVTNTDAKIKESQASQSHQVIYDFYVTALNMSHSIGHHIMYTEQTKQPLHR